MVLLEEIKHIINGTQVKKHFEEVAHVFNNVMISEQNGNYKVPQDSGELKVISFSNVTAKKRVGNIYQVFGVLFRYPDDNRDR